MKSFNIYFFIVCAVIFCSCSKNSNFIEPEQSISLDTIPSDTTLINLWDGDSDDEDTGGDPIDKSFTFIYKGKTYHTMPTIEDTIIFPDEETKIVYETLQKNPDLCTYVRPDGIIEFFDSFADFKSAENVWNPPYEPVKETPRLTYEFNLRIDDLNSFATKGVIEENNKDVIYQDKHDFSTINNGHFFKKSISFTFSMINETNTDSDIMPKWPVQAKFWIVFFDEKTYTGKTLAYNPNIQYSIGKKLQISQNLSNINWDNRIACVLIMRTL